MVFISIVLLDRSPQIQIPTARRRHKTRRRRPWPYPLHSRRPRLVPRQRLSGSPPNQRGPFSTSAPPFYALVAPSGPLGIETLVTQVFSGSSPLPGLPPQHIGPGRHFPAVSTTAKRGRASTRSRRRVSQAAPKYSCRFPWCDCCKSHSAGSDLSPPCRPARMVLRPPGTRLKSLRRHGRTR